jgi:hypothetical protein
MVGTGLSDGHKNCKRQRVYRIRVNPSYYITGPRIPRIAGSTRPKAAVTVTSPNNVPDPNTANKHGNRYGFAVDGKDIANSNSGLVASCQMSR